MLKKIRKMLKTQEGFTLVELMIVVVILGILAGIGVQQYGNVQARARKAADAANRGILMNATNMYLIMENPDLSEVGEGGAITYTPITIPEGNDNVLVPNYIDKWPVNPLDEDEDYVVTITFVPTTNPAFVGDGTYSITIAPVLDDD